MAGSTLLRGGAGLGGAVVGAALAPFTGGLSVPVMSGLGAALGAGASTAATGGKPLDAIINAGLGGVGGYMAGPTLNSALGLHSLASSTGAALPPGAGVTLDPGGLASLPSGSGGLSLGMPSLDTMQKVGIGTAAAGQIASLVNPTPQPFRGSGPISGPQFNPSAVNTQQFMIPIPPPTAPRFSLA